jgi:hypothetical protein
MGLSDMAYKLLCFTGSNKPGGFKRGVAFEKLIQPTFLNLERQVRTQGKPRIINTINKGFAYCHTDFKK